MIQVWVFHSMNGIYTDKNENYFSENIHKKKSTENQICFNLFTVNTCIIDWENPYALVMFTLHVHNSQLSTSSNYMNLHITYIQSRKILADKSDNMNTKEEYPSENYSDNYSRYQ